jgi:ABC-type bacteriocin/lantibiotic exporter with double-glycine peptidase domain
MKRCHALILPVCGIIFITAYKLTAWHYFSGQSYIAVEYATVYGGLVSGEWNSFIQTSPETCGQAALAFFLNSMGLKETETSIIDEIGTDSMLSLADMDRVFTSRGFKTQLLKVNPAYFRKHPTVAILHFSSRHFVVFLQENNGEPEIFDPAYGQVFVSWKKLLAKFSGYMLYVYK